VTPDLVLVIAEPGDTTADLVVEVLERRPVEIFRFDTGDFPQRLHLVASPGSEPSRGRLSLAGRSVDLSTVRSVYRRSPSFFAFPAGMSEPEIRFAEREAVQGLGGVLTGLRCRWVNHPWRVADAGFKPVQLQVAASVGLRVPRTLLTNVAAEAASFMDDVGQVVYKPLSVGVVAEADKVRVLSTTKLSAGDLDSTSIGLTVHQFQEWIPKAFDVRMTVVGERFFPVAIIAGSGAAQVDWRADYDALTYRVVDVPDQVRLASLALMRRLGLLHGAFDFSVTDDGSWWFLEINPNGAWAWIAEETGLPIADALADLLAAEFQS